MEQTQPVQNEWDVEHLKVKIEWDEKPEIADVLQKLSDEAWRKQKPEILKLFSKVRAETLEEVKKCVPEESNGTLQDGSKSFAVAGFNECRNQILSAINKLN